MRHDTYDSIFPADDDDATWLVTYADLVTILLVFFVLLYTLSFFEKEQYRKAVETIKVQVEENENLIGLMELMEIPETADTQITIEDITGLHSREKSLFNNITKFVQSSEQKQNISSRILDGKIIVTIKGKALFNSGSASLNNASILIFDEIVQILYDYPEYNINIKGHTDNIPISTPIFPSNWELSAIRATTVLQYLVLQGIRPQRLTATGYGDVMPLVPNTSEENRAQNRRVEFVLEKKEPRS
ncbi:OmpA/MotB family protein [Desulfobacula toluolica]|uniref:Outer membrane protein, related to OmpA/MotB n=1 Tax=Desulfobacula toluolica (strain DSM 7467 / Tol2) TaxID=651182 RepID=K0NNQ0_DESTT|nr:flagellar motor protein MotB [Desulfobacula toluolica]CCK80392.1 outer membrane protein, related to OmpA/MotB [Desulfobacula toluolica Tol2]